METGQGDKGDARLLCSSLNADGSKYEDGAHFSLSVCFLLFLYTSCVPILSLLLLTVSTSSFYPTCFSKSHLVAFLLLVSRGEEQLREMGQMGDRLLI